MNTSEAFEKLQAVAQMVDDLADTSRSSVTLTICTRQRSQQ